MWKTYAIWGCSRAVHFIRCNWTVVLWNNYHYSHAFLLWLLHHGRICDGNNVRISQLTAIHRDVIAQLKLESSLMDFCGNYVSTCLSHITSLLYKALGQRVSLIATKPLPTAVVSFWVKLKLNSYVRSFISIGTFDKYTCLVKADIGSINVVLSSWAVSLSSVRQMKKVK